VKGLKEMQGVKVHDDGGRRSDGRRRRPQRVIEKVEQQERG
jgi:hypothetical protein